jgi:hypothetical protein
VPPAAEEVEATTLEEVEAFVVLTEVERVVPTEVVLAFEVVLLAFDVVLDVFEVVLDEPPELLTTTPPGPATEVVNEPLSTYTPLK